ncbi:MAG: carbohydrate-binding family 9-like protein [Lentisphaeria bacterium]|nr:carbohydrate-binding family 9-like protein [Lentisphaeria bacterium]
MLYTVERTANAPSLDGDWDGAAWEGANTVEATNFRPESSDHRPNASFRVQYSATALHGIARVEDCYVRAVYEGFQAAVCRDSCAEFFFKPDVGPGYFNFEFSCGGSFLASYVLDCSRIGDEGLADCRMLTEAEGRQVSVWHSLPTRVEPEIAEPTVWTVQFSIPLAVLEPYCGAIGDLAGREWAGNFYKCGDETSHPHWASWAPVSELNFHLPDCFQPIVFV